jgi:hypothetical protein
MKDAKGQQLAFTFPVVQSGLTVEGKSYLYFEDEPQRQMSMKRLSRDEAFLIAVKIAKLPSDNEGFLTFLDRPRRREAARRRHRGVSYEERCCLHIFEKSALESE